MDQDATRYEGRPRPRPHRIRWGPSPNSKKGTAPNFRTISVVPIRLDGSRCHLIRRKASAQVRWGLSSPQMRNSSPQIFGPCLLWPNGSMNQNSTWYGERHRPMRHCVRWRHSLPPPSQKGEQQPFTFWPISTVANLSVRWGPI